MTAIIDIETDSEIVFEANLKFFGGLDCDSGEVTIFDYTERTKIRNYLKHHKVLVGYNIKNFDIPILQNYGIKLYGHQIVDLWEALAPIGDQTFGTYNKNRLHDINPGLILKNYKLKTIISALKLDKQNKGDIDYNIFKKNSWTIEEKNKIEEYLTQDLVIEYKLFDWYVNTFKPLEQYIKEEDVENYKHLTCASGSLAYKVMCYLTENEEDYENWAISREIKRTAPRIEGGHHIHARWEKVRGNIICKDFTSHYPTILLMYNLLTTEQGKALHKLLIERITAKQKGDKAKATALKVPINSIYGLLGNPTFINIYNPIAANDCTKYGRELLKRYAAELEEEGFISLYGFTDSVYAGIPKEFTNEDLNLITNNYINKIKKEVPNPIDSFGLATDGEYKFMWFIEKKDNQYLCVTKDNQVKIKGGLFDKNTPDSITKLFEDYIKPKIIKELDINFTEQELEIKLKELLKTKPELAAEEYKVKDISAYKVETTLQYQISKKYGVGVHSLIPNTAGIGVGRREDMKYCNQEEFKKAKLTINDIHIVRMLKYLIPFYTTKESVTEL